MVHFDRDADDRGTVLAGPGAWDGDETIRRAIEIRGGIIQNPEILSFQHRASHYPHQRLG